MTDEEDDFRTNNSAFQFIHLDFHDFDYVLHAA